MPTFSELITKKDRTQREDMQLSDAAQAMEGLLWDLEQLLQRSAPAGRIYFDKLGIHIRAGTSDTRRPEIQFIAGGKDAGKTARFAGYSITDNEAGPYVVGNGYYDGTNWNNDDTTQNGGVYSQGPTIIHQFRYLPSGGNPSTPVSLLELYTDYIKIPAFLNFAFVSELTIATGAITVTGTNHTVDTQDDDPSDELDTINGGAVSGNILILRAAHFDRTIVIKDSTGNINCAGDFSMDNSVDTITLMFDGANWVELSRANNGT